MCGKGVTRYVDPYHISLLSAFAGTTSIALAISSSAVDYKTARDVTTNPLVEEPMAVFADTLQKYRQSLIQLRGRRVNWLGEVEDISKKGVKIKCFEFDYINPNHQSTRDAKYYLTVYVNAEEVKWTPNTGPLDRGVFVKGLPHVNWSGFPPGRPWPGSGRPRTDGDAPRRQIGSRTQAGLRFHTYNYVIIIMCSVFDHPPKRSSNRLSNARPRPSRLTPSPASSQQPVCVLPVG
jgi:hypothetical protein